MSLEIQGSVEDSQDVDVIVGSGLVNDSIAAVQQDADVRVLLGLVEVAYVGKPQGEMRLVPDASDDLV